MQDFQHFQKIELTQDFDTTINGKALKGAIGYVAGEYLGYDIVFDMEEPVNAGKLVKSGTNDGQFMLIKVPVVFTSPV